jgi:hypothetical protein
VTTQSSPLLLSSCTDEQAQELLSTIVQLGNRRDIEQLKNKIQVIKKKCKRMMSLFLCITVISNKLQRLSNI